MAREVDSLLLTMSADIRGLKRQLQEANGTFDREARKMEKRQRELERKFEQLGAGLGRGLQAASLVAAGAFGAIVGYSIKAAASAAELKNAFDVAFGAGAKGAEAYAKALSEKVGRSQLEVMESMTRFRLLLKDQDKAVAEDLIEALQARAIDVGSLFNLKDADVVQKFFSGLSGETEPLKALGVNLNEAALKAELLRLGFKGNATAAPEAVKQVARANIILRETQIAAGDAAKTIDSTANRFKKLQGETRDAAAAFGEQFLPIANKVIAWATDALTAFNKLPGGMQVAGLAALGLVAAAGPLAQLAVGLSRIIKLANEARLALAGAAAVQAGAGGLGAAGAAGLGAGAFGAGAAIVAPFAIGVGMIPSDAPKFRKVKANPRTASDEDLAKAIAYAAANVSRLARENAPAGRALLAQLKADEAKLRGEAARRAEVVAKANPLAPGGGSPQFGLTPEQLKAAAAAGGLGSGGAGRAGPKGTKSDPIAVDPITLPEIGRVGGELTPFEQVQAAADAFRRREEAKTQGVDGFDAGFGFEATPDFRAFMAQMTGPIAELKRQADEQLEQGIYDGLVSGMRAAADGHAIDYLKARLQEAIIDAAARGLTEAITSALAATAGSTAGNLLSAGVNFLFGGGRAVGGPVSAGKIYEVGERGRELFAPGVSGTIIPNNTLRRMEQAPQVRQSPTTVVVQQTLQLSNYGPTTKEFMGEIQRIARSEARGAAAQGTGIAMRGVPSALVFHQKMSG